MEIILVVIVMGLLGYWAYTNFNKEKPNGSHVLDTFTKPVETAPPAPVAESVKVEAAAPVDPAPKAKRAPAVKKPAAPRAPARPRVKKTPAP